MIASRPYAVRYIGVAIIVINVIIVFSEAPAMRRLQLQSRTGVHYATFILLACARRPAQCSGRAYCRHLHQDLCNPTMSSLC